MLIVGMAGVSQSALTFVLSALWSGVVVCAATTDLGDGIEAVQRANLTKAQVSDAW